MSVIAQVREELALFYELLARKATKAESIVHAKLASLHDGLVGLETKISVLEVDVVKEVRKIVAEVKGEADPVVAKLDAAIKVTDTAAENLKAAFEASQKAQAPVAAAPAASSEAASPVVDVSQQAAPAVETPVVTP